MCITHHSSVDTFSESISSIAARFLTLMSADSGLGYTTVNIKRSCKQ